MIFGFIIPFLFPLLVLGFQDESSFHSIFSTDDDNNKEISSILRTKLMAPEEETWTAEGKNAGFDSASDDMIDTDSALVAGKRDSFETLHKLLQEQVSNSDPHGKYKFGRVIGRGSKGVVFAAKVLPMNTRRNVAHALRDLFFLQHLAHIPWVPAPEDLVQQKVQGETLRTLSPHLITDLIAKRILFQIISMVAFLEANNICHNDISLSNVMVDRPSQRLFLIDFADSSLIVGDSSITSNSTSTPSSSSSSSSFTASSSVSVGKFVSIPKFLSGTKYQHLTITVDQCKDRKKLLHLAVNWIEKTKLESRGVKELLRHLNGLVKNQTQLKSILFLPIFADVTRSNLIELRGRHKG